jgi:chondroitin AC lyase
MLFRILILLVAALDLAPASPTDAALILERASEMLSNGASPAASSLQPLTAGQLPDGSWPDIDYADTSRNRWQPLTHLTRLAELARGLDAAPSLLPAIHRGVDLWIDRRPQSDNWWYNEIGTPRAMRDLIVLMGGQLAGERLDGCMQVLAQRRMRATGANLMWSAELALHHGAILASRYDSPGREQGLAELAEAARRIHEEIQVGLAEGIQPDQSFYQHGARLQSFHYGRAYLDVAVNLGWQLRGTPWAYPPAKAEIITDYILDGLQWMSRGRYTVPPTLDRSVSRPGSMSADLARPLTLWRDVAATRREELDNLLARQSASGTTVIGFRHFPHADFTTYHHPSFSFFLTGASSRMLLTEAINSENQLGSPHLLTGDHYLLRHEDEYDNLQPVWDWSRLPGLTTSPARPVFVRQEFAGGLGDGQRGLAAIRLQRSGDNHTLAMNRLCAMNAKAIVCQLYPASPGAPGDAHTSLEQNRLRGPVWISEDGARQDRVPGGTAVERTVRWIWHDDVGYLLDPPLHVRVYAGPREGNWRQINHAYSAETVTQDVFLAEVLHGADPKPFSYTILPGVSLHELSAAAAKPASESLANASSKQALRFDDGAHFAAFYEPGTLDASGLSLLETDHACLALFDDESLWLADPRNAGFTIRVRWKGQRHTVRLPSGGRPIQIR